MAKILRCADVREDGCAAVFRGDGDLEVLAQILEHWAGVHQVPTTTSRLVTRMWEAIRDDQAESPA